MNPLPGLALMVVALTASRARAQDCPSAQALEQRLLAAPVETFVAKIEPARPGQDWRLGATGGFRIAAPPLGEVTTFLHATATTSCGLSIGWTPVWNSDGRITSAGQFRVARIEDRPRPRASQKYGATLFGVTPDMASQTAWLTLTYGGRTSNFLLNFPATTLSVGPVSHHSGGVWLEVMGVRVDGALIYADFGGAEPR